MKTIDSLYYHLVTYCCMVLTPDQKKRIAALDSTPASAEEETEGGKKALSRLPSFWLSLRMLIIHPSMLKVLIVFALGAVATFFILEYQLHRIDFQKVFSSGLGTPISRLSNEVKTQKQKGEMLEKGNTYFLDGKYRYAFDTGVAITEIDPDDISAYDLIDRTAGATIRKATRKFDSGEIESALVSVRLALSYKPEHEAANELYMNIADRLLHEAKLHLNKKEYPQVITKTQEVQKIITEIRRMEISGIADSDFIMKASIESSNLLGLANNELLASAEELFDSKHYFDALRMVRLSMRIDRKNAVAIDLMKEISEYVEIPKLKLKGIITSGDTNFAQIQLPGSGKGWLAKKGDIIGIGKNCKVINIDSDQKQVKLLQIHSKTLFTISKPKRD
jgi:tetratricopeptide (TPR) repeat protein